MSHFEGKLFVITAPSGAGKTTLVSIIKKKINQLDFSISATTRSKRNYEKDGVDYFFISTEEFLKLKKEGAFVESEMVYENQYYGTLRSEIDRIWSLQKHILFDIDVMGASALKKIYGHKCITIFVKPPSFEILVERLYNRKTESSESIQKRIKKAKKELGFESHFDYVLVNDQLEIAQIQLEKIILSHL